MYCIINLLTIIYIYIYIYIYKLTYIILFVGTSIVFSYVFIKIFNLEGYNIYTLTKFDEVI